MDIETVWEAFKTLEAQLKAARKDIPVTRTELADLMKDMNELTFRVDHIQTAVKEQYTAGIKTGLTAAVLFAGVTVLMHRLLPK